MKNVGDGGEWRRKKSRKEEEEIEKEEKAVALSISTIFTKRVLRLSQQGKRLISSYIIVKQYRE